MKRFSILAMALILLSSVTFAATVGYIDGDRIQKSYKQAEKATKEFMKMEADYQKLVAEKQQELNSARIEGKSDKELEKILEQVKKEIEPKKAELEKMMQTTMLKIRQDVVTATESVAKDLGIDVVLDKQVVITGGVDITDMVINKLNEKK